MATDPHGWAAVVAESVPGAAVRQVHRLGGGIAAETFAVDTTDTAIVVKRYPSRRETVELEWERLRFAQRVDVPVPEPLALDLDGRWFGMPAFAMTRLAGRPDVQPRQVDPWLRQLAQTLVAIHTTDTTDAGGALVRPSAVETWQPPTLARPDPLAVRTIAAIQSRLPHVSLATHPDPRRLPPGQHPVGRQQTQWHRRLERDAVGSGVLRTRNVPSRRRPPSRRRRGRPIDAPLRGQRGCSTSRPPGLRSAVWTRDSPVRSPNAHGLSPTGTDRHPTSVRRSGSRVPPPRAH